MNRKAMAVYVLYMPSTDDTHSDTLALTYISDPYLAQKITYKSFQLSNFRGPTPPLSMTVVLLSLHLSYPLSNFFFILITPQSSPSRESPMKPKEAFQLLAEGLMPGHRRIIAVL